MELLLIRACNVHADSMMPGTPQVYFKEALQSFGLGAEDIQQFGWQNEHVVAISAAMRSFTTKDLRGCSGFQRQSVSNSIA